MTPKLLPISSADSFQFECSSAVACFNECCRDLNQYLTPYDILRLKTALGMESDDFLQTYTRSHLGPESGLPIVTLKPGNQRTLTCPFVSPSGCRVYRDRPSSCRTYPIVRAIRRDRATGNLNEDYLLLKEAHCMGFDQQKTQSVREWVINQEILPYNQFNDMLMELIALKNQRHPQPLDKQSSDIFKLALYDLDRFRTHLFKEKRAGDFDADKALLESAQSDDSALLQVGIQYVKTMIFFSNSDT